MPYYRRDDDVQNGLGYAIPNVAVTYYVQPGLSLATIYSSSTGGSASNPQYTDGLGHAAAYMDSGIYTITYSGNQIQTLTLPDQEVGDNSGGLPTVNVYTETPNGAVNGSNRVYTLTYSPEVLWLEAGGIFLTETTDYALNENVITMNYALAESTVFTAIYTYGSYAADIISETPSGVVDGVNRVFTSSKQMNLNATWLYNSGVFQTQGIDFLVTNGNTCTYTVAPEEGTELHLQYVSTSGGQTFNVITTEVPSPLPDGTNTVFHLSKVPIYLLLQQNQGVLQGGGIGYTQVGTTITFTVAPLEGDYLLATIFA